MKLIDWLAEYYAQTAPCVNNNDILESRRLDFKAGFERAKQLIGDSDDEDWLQIPHRKIMRLGEEEHD